MSAIYGTASVRPHPSDPAAFRVRTTTPEGRAIVRKVPRFPALGETHARRHALAHLFGDGIPPALVADVVADTADVTTYRLRAPDLVPVVRYTVARSFIGAASFPTWNVYRDGALVVPTTYREAAVRVVHLLAAADAARAAGRPFGADVGRTLDAERADLARSPAPRGRGACIICGS